ncbi:hypothetical protein [Priestia flexa]|nr:hypothetical protein [Priestia flexa]
MSLFDECIEALGEDVHVFSDNNREQILSNFESSGMSTLNWTKIIRAVV